MDRLEYNGEVYTRTQSKWTDSRHVVVHQSLQKELNKLFMESIDYLSYSVEELIEEGDKFKDSDSYADAVNFYEHAINKGGLEVIKMVLPRISSCYRKCNMPRKTIELFTRVKREYGTEFITPVLLTSVAAAYCDIKEYENALRCCKWAYSRFGGRADESLRLVYARISSESGLC